MNAELRERASELAREHELDMNRYTAKAIRDLLAEVERLEEELKEQKRAAWNHEGVSRDYILAMQKVKSRDEQIDALTRQRDMLAKEMVRISKVFNCRACDDGDCCLHATKIARQALVAAGMERPEKRAD